MNGEQQIMIRYVHKGQRTQKQGVLITVYKPEGEKCDCEHHSYSITCAPEWLKDPICSVCGKPAEPSDFYKGGKATLLQIDDGIPEVVCDRCRDKRIKQSKQCKHVLMEEEVGPEPTPQEMVWHTRFEWSVTGERWYSVKGERIEPYVSYSIDEEQLHEKFMEFINLVMTGKQVSIKGQYNKETKILRVDISSYS